MVYGPEDEPFYTDLPTDIPEDAPDFGDQPDGDTDGSE